MFQVICTGENLNYGKKGEKRLMSDPYTLYALKRGWITDKFKWVGNNKTASKLKYKEELMPIKRINLERSLESVSNRIKRATDEINKSNTILIGLKKLQEDAKNGKTNT